MMKITNMPRMFVTNMTIIRFYWTDNDVRELLLERDYCPYINISGTYFADFITYPQKSAKYKTWDLREVIGEKYKFMISDNKETFNQTVKFRFQITLPQKVFVKDLESVIVGKYSEETKTYEIKEKEIVSQENKIIAFYSNDVGIYSLLVERKSYFPYKNWRIRCIDKNLAVLTLDSKNTLTFSNSSDNYLHIRD